jgi:hypothetical protein
LSAAKEFALCSKPTKSAAAESQWRKIVVMTTSNTKGVPADKRSRPVDKGGIFGPPSAWRGAGPALLAVFVERPQAACSNRRYIYSLETRMQTVNEKICSVESQNCRT